MYKTVGAPDLGYKRPILHPCGRIAYDLSNGDDLSLSQSVSFFLFLDPIATGYSFLMPPCLTSIFRIRDFYLLPYCTIATSCTLQRAQQLWSCFNHLLILPRIQNIPQICNHRTKRQGLSQMKVDDSISSNVWAARLHVPPCAQNVLSARSMTGMPYLQGWVCISLPQHPVYCTVSSSVGARKGQLLLQLGYGG